MLLWVVVQVFFVGAHGDTPTVQTTYMWHMQQPTYWPAPSNEGRGYQFAYESMTRKGDQGGHPQNDIASIFGKDDRVNGYTHYAVDAINQCKDLPDMGAQMSFGGDLMEGVQSLAEQSSCNYKPGWNSTYATFDLKTSGGLPRLDLVRFTYHHALLPLVHSRALDMELQIDQLAKATFWGGSYLSKGLFPAEMTFSESAIPALVKAGVEWVIVANNHLSRAVPGYPFSPSGDNNDPPNKADQINKVDNSSSFWFTESVSRGVRPMNVAPFAYTPHYAQHVDASTGKVSKIVVVPAAMAMSWVDSTGCYSTGDISKISASLPAGAVNASHPMLALLAHDGDNAFSGGNSYYEQCVSQFAHDKSIHATTIQQYLDTYPVAEDDVVGVEEGAWINHDGDFGAPQMIGWNWPPTNSSNGFDIPAGYSVAQRQYALTVAASNWVFAAEAASPSPVRAAEVQRPTAAATAAELAWHFFLPSQTSGYLYYGNVLDMPDKQTVSCNEAVKQARAAGVATANDVTPPTMFRPQRMPWNPGAYGAGALWKFKYTPMPRDFYVWTYAADSQSGMKSVTLMYRVDADGVNPRETHDNELYTPADNSAVGAWQPLPMTAFPTPPGNHSNVKFDFVPLFPLADRYYAKVTGMAQQLVDYYIEATDNAGNVEKSNIFHVWVE